MAVVFRFKNKSNGRTISVDIDNVSRKFTEAFKSGEMPLREFAFYLDGKSRNVHEQLHRHLGIKDYDGMIIEIG